MQIIKQTFNEITPAYDLSSFAPINKILFIDIETTGLSKEHTSLYIIGCGYFNKEGYHTIQWFADNENEESILITKFYEFIRNGFKCILHYNGNHFDIPYLNYKALKYGITDLFEGILSSDIYMLIKPYKKLLGLPSLKQRCIEQFLNIHSDDPYTGRELISVYHDYVKNHNKSLLDALLYHNSEDLLGMTKILPILYYTNIKATQFDYTNYTVNKYIDYNNDQKTELLITYTHNASIPVGFNVTNDKCMLSLKNTGTAILRLPIINTTLKHFYNNYKDYYYLPLEDTCIHKAVAASVDRNYRENAKKETCYTKYSDLFIPNLNCEISPLREAYKDKISYITYSEDNCTDYFKSISENILNYFFS